MYAPAGQSFLLHDKARSPWTALDRSISSWLRLQTVLLSPHLYCTWPSAILAIYVNTYMACCIMYRDDRCCAQVCERCLLLPISIETTIQFVEFVQLDSSVVDKRYQLPTMHPLLSLDRGHRLFAKLQSDVCNSAWSPTGPVLHDIFRSYNITVLFNIFFFFQLCEIT